MPLNLDDKKRIVAEVHEVAGSALSVVLADYRGVTVDEMTVLRRSAKENQVYLRVVRNSLLRRAVENTEFECIRDALTGPTLLAFAQQDPGSAARVLQEFAAENDRFDIKALALGGRLLGPGDVDLLAKLPTIDQARAMLMGVMLAPVGGLARAAREVPAKLARALAAVRDQKQAADPTANSELTTNLNLEN